MASRAAYPSWESVWLQINGSLIQEVQLSVTGERMGTKYW